LLVGYNGQGGLGLGHNQDQSLPNKLEYLSNKAKSVSCGTYHSIVKLNKNIVVAEDAASKNSSSAASNNNNIYFDESDALYILGGEYGITNNIVARIAPTTSASSLLRIKYASGCYNSTFFITEGNEIYYLDYGNGSMANQDKNGPSTRFTNDWKDFSTVNAAITPSSSSPPVPFAHLHSNLFTFQKPSKTSSSNNGSNNGSNNSSSNKSTINDDNSNSNGFAPFTVSQHPKFQCQKRPRLYQIPRGEVMQPSEEIKGIASGYTHCIIQTDSHIYAIGINDQGTWLFLLLLF